MSSWPTRYLSVIRTGLIVAGCIVAVMLPVEPAQCQTRAGQTESASPDSLAQKVDENTYRLGNLTLDRSAGTITIPGRVNMNHSLVEYLAVTPDGKTHESVLVLDVQPLHVQTALLLFGLEFGQNLSYQGDSTRPAGDSVLIEVAFVSAAGDSVRLPASALLIDQQHDSEVPDMPWIFTGSMLFEGRLMADVEGSIIAVYADPVAILNCPLAGRADDTMFGANPATVPEAGTPVTMTITILR